MYENLCEPWPATLCSDICGYSPTVTGAAFLAASETLWEATGRRFSNCPVTVRPCRSDCAPVDDRAVGGWPHPALVDGSWINVACGLCTGPCGCTTTSEIVLPDFARVSEVSVDGVVLGEGDWILYDGQRLVRVGAEWPWCQEWNVVTGAGVFSVTAAFGPEVPDLGKLAVGILAVEIMKQMCNEDCALPYKTTSVSRRGVSITRDAEGLTGLTIPDLFIKTYNPKGLQDRIRAWSPDLMIPRVNT